MLENGLHGNFLQDGGKLEGKDYSRGGVILGFNLVVEYRILR